MPTNSDPERLRSVKTLSSLLAYLRDELDWPIDSDDVEDVTFDYDPEELGFTADAVVHIREIKQLRPLVTGQPWGVFWVSFEKKRLPVVMMRRILAHLVVKRRAAARDADRRRWQLNDLLFISAYGEEAEREISLAHFAQDTSQTGELPVLRVLGWDGADTILKLEHLAATLRDKLRWPANPSDVQAWRVQWRSPFRHRIGHVIRTADALAEMLAALARRIRNAAQSTMRVESEKGSLTKLFKAFQASLIHDLTEEGFADTYAQTITYGLLTAAISKTDMNAGAAGTALIAGNITEMVPVTNPFLKEMLQIFLKVGGRKGGIDFDELGIQDVVELLRGDETDLPAILRDFGNKKPGEDPVIHFYEHFLAAYDKQMKIQRGVFYTPQPVVSYIVRSVHELLKSEFGLEDGLASTVTWGEMVLKHPDLRLPPKTDEHGETRTIDPGEFFVQILDPATGTATFLVEVIDIVHRHLRAKWEKGGLAAMPAIPSPPKGTPAPGRFEDYWNVYVPHALLPRLHGYELMMAPYAIAHMKIGLKLAETGYRFGTEERARIYLTNALEPKVKQLPQIGFDALAHEAAAVNEIKWYKRFTVVIGNPPYSLYGQLNRIPYILDLLQDYKRDLDEKKVNLDDDFIKFVRHGHHLISATQIGILGVITNNTYLDGITHRVMRSSLMDNFNRIALLDLHGSTKRLERNPNGGADANVFDIQTGVVISLLIRGASSTGIQYGDLWGTRDDKYEHLSIASVQSTEFRQLAPCTPYFFFRPKDMRTIDEYQAWPGLKSIFLVGGCGIKTERDPVTVCWTLSECRYVVEDFCMQSEESIRKKYDLGTDSRDWTIPRAKADVKSNVGESLFRRVLYRPFDVRHIWYSGQTRGFIGTPSYPTVKHLLADDNIALLSCRQQAQTGFHHTFCVNRIVDHSALSTTSREITSAFPLYLSDEILSFQLHRSEPQSYCQITQRPNLAPAFLKTLAATLKLSQKGAHGLPAGLTPEDIFHYAYAVFHSPGYRSRYAEFLKIDFPRLPLTGSLELFRALARLGGELVALHLLESPKVDQPITEFVGCRNPEVEKVSWSKNIVWVDKAQTSGFKGVPEAVWNFHIGGYQVCEKWLKDRKGRTLSNDDIVHYQKVVVALAETIRLMVEIDKVIVQHGGWPCAFGTVQTVPPTAALQSPPADLGLRTEDELPLR
jgi:hypothetical protein